MLKAIEILDKWPCLIEFHAEENVTYQADSSRTYNLGDKKSIFKIYTCNLGCLFTCFSYGHYVA